MTFDSDFCKKKEAEHSSRKSDIFQKSEVLCSNLAASLKKSCGSAQPCKKRGGEAAGRQRGRGGGLAEAAEAPAPHERGAHLDPHEARRPRRHPRVVRRLRTRMNNIE